MPNKSHYNGNVKSSAAIRGPDTPQYHIDRIVGHTRRTALVACREFQCRIVILRQSAFLANGCEFTWPMAEGTCVGCCIQQCGKFCVGANEIS